MILLKVTDPIRFVRTVLENTILTAAFAVVLSITSKLVYNTRGKWFRTVIVLGQRTDRQRTG